MKRGEIGALIADRLAEAHDDLRAQFQRSEATIGHFVLDDLLPPELAHDVFGRFPTPGDMTLNRSLREHKQYTPEDSRWVCIGYAPHGRFVRDDASSCSGDAWSPPAAREPAVDAQRQPG